MNINQIDTYTQRQVFQTAQKYILQENSNPFTENLHHGINQVCICCKAGSVTSDGKPVGHVEKIINAVDLKPWTDFYKLSEFAAYKCYSCGYQWSWFKPSPQNTK